MTDHTESIVVGLGEMRLMEVKLDEMSYGRGARWPNL